MNGRELLFEAKIKCETAKKRAGEIINTTIYHFGRKTIVLQLTKAIN